MNGEPMKQIDFYFDFISPFAYLAFEQLPEVLQGHSYQVRYRPVLFASLLQQHGQLGPAEIPGKRDWTYRQVLWLAHRHGIALQMPARHPFNPLPLLRLAVACGIDGEPSRYVTETLFRHVWCGGLDAVDAERLQALVDALAPGRDLQDAGVKAQLRQFGDEAAALGLFGVPSLVVDGKVFWGLDALPMLRDYLAGDPWFATGEWDAAGRIAPGQVRRDRIGKETR
jgi:2-hydroxychromene-2-carboxylate isomerase